MFERICEKFTVQQKAIPRVEVAKEFLESNLARPWRELIGQKCNEALQAFHHVSGGAERILWCEVGKSHKLEEVQAANESGGLLDQDLKALAAKGRH